MLCHAYRWDIRNGGSKVLPGEGGGCMDSSSGGHADAHSSTACWGRPACLYPQDHARFFFFLVSFPGGLFVMLKIESPNSICVCLLFTGFSLTPRSLEGEGKIQFYHHYIEAVKFANGQRRSIRDPLFNSETVRI